MPCAVRHVISGHRECAQLLRVHNTDPSLNGSRPAAHSGLTVSSIALHNEGGATMEGSAVLVLAHGAGGT